MNDERCDRDRVTAILTLAEDASPGRPWEADGAEIYESLGHDLDRREADASYIVAACNAFPDVAAALLEALDTIDKARDLHQPEESPGWITRCVRCQTPWPCDDWQALNGGNE